MQRFSMTLLYERVLPILFGITAGIIFVFLGLHNIFLSKNPESFQGLAIGVTVQEIAHWAWILGFYVLIVGILFFPLTIVPAISVKFRKVCMVLTGILGVAFVFGYFFIQQIAYWSIGYFGNLPFDTSLGLVGMLFAAGTVTLLVGEKREKRLNLT